MDLARTHPACLLDRQFHENLDLFVQANIIIIISSSSSSIVIIIINIIITILIIIIIIIISIILILIIIIFIIIIILFYFIYLFIYLIFFWGGGGLNRHDLVSGIFLYWPRDCGNFINLVYPTHGILQRTGYFLPATGNEYIISLRPRGCPRSQQAWHIPSVITFIFCNDSSCYQGPLVYHVTPRPCIDLFSRTYVGHTKASRCSKSPVRIDQRVCSSRSNVWRLYCNMALDAYSGCPGHGKAGHDTGAMSQWGCFQRKKGSFFSCVIRTGPKSQKGINFVAQVQLRLGLKKEIVCFL